LAKRIDEPKAIVTLARKLLSSSGMCSWPSDRSADAEQVAFMLTVWAWS
jgi:hypothetical protein